MAIAWLAASRKSLTGICASNGSISFTASSRDLPLVVNASAWRMISPTVRAGCAGGFAVATAGWGGDSLLAVSGELEAARSTGRCLQRGLKFADLSAQFAI